MKKILEKTTKKEIIMKGLNFLTLKISESKSEKELYFFLTKTLIFWIIVIVVFYKNKMIFAMLDS